MLSAAQVADIDDVTRATLSKYFYSEAARYYEERDIQQAIKALNLGHRINPESEDILRLKENIRQSLLNQGILNQEYLLIIELIRK